MSEKPILFSGPMVRDRDRLAAALAEVRRLRDAWAAVDPASGWMPSTPQHALLTVSLDAADLATARDARVRAEALRDAAGAYGREAEPEAAFVRDWLRAEADRIERGER